MFNPVTSDDQAVYLTKRAHQNTNLPTIYEKIRQGAFVFI
jgi:hypothetical protein